MSGILVGRDNDGNLVIDMEVFANYVGRIADECMTNNEIWFAAYSTISRMQSIFAARSVIISNEDKGDTE